MFARILRLFRDKIRSRMYVMTRHARKEMNDDALTIYDVEHGILKGKIIERQHDRLTAEYKYRISGKTLEGGKMEVIAKLSQTGKVIIITVYLVQEGEV